ncbi:acetyltransferase [Paenibacillus oryzisoli]|uniref:Sugar acetyltransferase n=1 Tax=Paenibacillus oryzisoli TaxID=1850517 RepID=A0A198A0G6_9BACL|nr:acetyltransferase [Paenibacillus oryzisoli]OAS14513.1 sugar acetyltransferase [Paenibacillus oryzisoli]
MTKTPVIILGSGGHAKVLIDILQIQNIEITGICSPDMTFIQNVDNGIHVLSSDADIFEHQPDKVLLVNGLGSVKSTAKREEIFKMFKSKGYTFATVVHPSAIISQNARLLEGAQIMAGAIIQTDSVIGVNSIVSTKASVDHDCKIGNHVHVAPGATLSGGITVDDGVHIGTGATIIQGIHIGRNSLVAAGAVVTKEVREFSVVRGIPAKEL